MHGQLVLSHVAVVSKAEHVQMLPHYMAVSRVQHRQILGCAIHTVALRTAKCRHGLTGGTARSVVALGHELGPVLSADMLVPEVQHVRQPVRAKYVILNRAQWTVYLASGLDTAHAPLLVAEVLRPVRVR